MSFDDYNCEFDAHFYDDFTLKCKDMDNEWKQAIDLISKLRVRFSANSKVLLTAFIEYLIRQIIANGVYCCMTDGKKIIKLRHALDTSKDDFETRCPLFSLIYNLHVYREALPKIKNEAYNAENLVEYDDSQYHFRFYIIEICKDVKRRMLPDGGKTSISKDLKNFCSRVAIELIVRIGLMLHEEINMRNVKTVNDDLICSTIKNAHIMAGLRFDETMKFVTDRTDTYKTYMDTVREQRRKRKQTNEILRAAGSETNEEEDEIETEDETEEYDD